MQNTGGIPAFNERANAKASECPPRQRLAPRSADDQSGAGNGAQGGAQASIMRYTSSADIPVMGGEPSIRVPLWNRPERRECAPVGRREPVTARDGSGLGTSGQQAIRAGDPVIPIGGVSGCGWCWLRLGQCSGANRAVKCRSCRGWDTMRMPGSQAARLATRVTTSIT